MQSGDSSAAAAMPRDGEHDAAAKISALLLQASTSADASQTESALSGLFVQLQDGGGWPAGVGECDILAAALDAMHQHESELEVQHDGVIVVYQLLGKPPVEAAVPKSLQRVLHDDSLRPLDTSRPASPTQRARTVRAVAKALPLLLAAGAVDEKFVAVCSEVVCYILNAEDAKPVDDAVLGACAAAMRARPDAAVVQVILLDMLCKLFAAPRTLPGSAEVKEVLCATVSAMKLHRGDASLSYEACELFAGLKTPTEAQLALDVGALSALLDELRHGSPQDDIGERRLRSSAALRALLVLLNLQPMLVRQHFCAAGAYEAIVHAMRSRMTDCTLQVLACSFVAKACVFGCESLAAVAMQNVDAAIAAGVPDAVLAAHAAHGEADELLDVRSCSTLFVLTNMSTLFAAASFHGPVPAALMASLQRRSGNRDMQALCGSALETLCRAARRSGRALSLPEGAVVLLTRVAQQCIFDGASCNACKLQLATCNTCGYSNSYGAPPTRILHTALFVIVELLRGADAITCKMLVQQALNAGLVEVCAHTAAAHAHTGGAEQLDRAATCVLERVVDESLLGALRTAACGMHKLATSMLAALPADHKTENLSDLQKLSELRTLVRNHAASCGEPHCPLCTMARDKCCLPSCGARHSKGGGPLKHCGGCCVAAFCCNEHQRAQWPQHKALCRARAAVEAARRRLKAAQGTAERS